MNVSLGKIIKTARQKNGSKQKSVDDIAQMPKTEFRQLLLKFHPDKNPGNEEFCQEVFSMINNLRVAA